MIVNTKTAEPSKNLQKKY